MRIISIVRLLLLVLIMLYAFVLVLADIYTSRIAYALPAISAFDTMDEEELSIKSNTGAPGVFYDSAKFAIVNSTTGNKITEVLRRDIPYELRDLSLVLVSCWKQKELGPLAESKALLKISHENQIVFYSWIFSLHRSATLARYGKYAFYLRECVGS